MATNQCILETQHSNEIHLSLDEGGKTFPCKLDYLDSKTRSVRLIISKPLRLMCGSN
jgi:hypothetical protein